MTVPAKTKGKRIFLAFLEYARPHLRRYRVLRETSKSYFMDPDKVEGLIGSGWDYMPRSGRLPKAGVHSNRQYFEDGAQAVKFLIERLAESIKDHEIELRKMKASMEKLNALDAALRRGEKRL